MLIIHNNNFTCGTLNLVLQTTDVIVRQDEASTGVYIECIEITNSRGESTVVPVRNWTSKTQSEERISVGGGGDQEGSARSSKGLF